LLFQNEACIFILRCLEFLLQRRHPSHPRSICAVARHPCAAGRGRHGHGICRQDRIAAHRVQTQRIVLNKEPLQSRWQSGAQRMRINFFLRKSGQSVKVRLVVKSTAGPYVVEQSTVEQSKIESAAGGHQQRIEPTFPQEGERPGGNPRSPLACVDIDEFGSDAPSDLSNASAKSSNLGVWGASRKSGHLFKSNVRGASSRATCRCTSQPRATCLP
jgi:hypothetical protein